MIPQEDGKGRDEILTAMKAGGLTFLQAIKASRLLFGVGLGEAKALVAAHPAWVETAEAARPFQDAVAQAFRETEALGDDAGGLGGR